MQLKFNFSSLNSHVKMLFTRNRLLLIMLLASALLHILLLTELRLSLPHMPEDTQQPLKIRLVQKPPPPPVQQKPTPTIKPKIKHKAPVKKPVEPFVPPAPLPVSPTLEAVQDTTPLVTSESQDAPQAEGHDNTETTTAIVQEEQPTKAIYYRHVETEFEVIRGNDKAAAGITRISFNIDENNHYSIISITQAKGLVSLFFDNLVQKSEGSVTENGLRPDFYSYQYGDNAKKSQAAHFAWDQNTLHLHTAKGESSTNLSPGTQDFLSFMYQFMFSAPLDNMQITMTNGKRLRTYTYSFEGEKTINTKLGMLNTIHLLRSGDDEEKTEIWLATDYLYLPVKIRKTEKDGDVIEQIAASLKTELSE